MKTIKRVEVKPIFVEFIPEILEQNCIYITEKYKTASHNCLCGCGERTVTPLNNEDWTLIKNGDKISLTPSIGNFSFPCRSHYVITNSIAHFI